MKADRSSSLGGPDRLGRAGLLEPQTHAGLRASDNLLRTVEPRLRLIHNRAYPDLPDEPSERLGLARRLHDDAPSA
jgi:glutamate-ammonia-ligase adenylyltransferase